MRMLPGTQLNAPDRQHVLAAYVHRFTKDHRPEWSNRPWKGNQSYPVQFASDYEWLEHTLFAVRSNGRLDMRAHFCQSNPTWPDNPELRHGAPEGRSLDDRQVAGMEVQS